MRLGVIGWGAIGEGVGRRIMDGAVPNVELAAVMRRSAQHVAVETGRSEAGSTSSHGAASARSAPVVVGDLDAFLAQDLDLVVEAAGAECLRALAGPVLRSGASLLAMSSSALIDDAFRSTLIDDARATGAKIYVPAGAIGGVDAVTAGLFGGLAPIDVVQRKPPAALLPGAEAADMTAPRELSHVSAREAGRNFPKNANIIVGLGLAVGDLDAVTVRIVADPSVSRNTVEYEVEGAFGRMRVTMENEPSANKRTSQMAIYSALGAIGRISQPLVLGA